MFQKQSQRAYGTISPESGNPLTAAGPSLPWESVKSVTHPAPLFLSQDTDTESGRCWNHPPLKQVSTVSNMSTAAPLYFATISHLLSNCQKETYLFAPGRNPMDVRPLVNLAMGGQPVVLKEKSLSTVTLASLHKMGMQNESNHSTERYWQVPLKPPPSHRSILVFSHMG